MFIPAVGIAVSSGFLYLAKNSAGKKLSSKLSPLELFTLYYLAATVLVSLAFWLSKNRLDINPNQLLPIASIVLTIAALGIVSGCLQLWILKKFPFSSAGPLFSLQPLIVVCLAFLFLKESLSVIQVIGIVGASLGAFGVSLAKNKNQVKFCPKLLFYVFVNLAIFSLLSVAYKILLSQTNFWSGTLLIYLGTSTCCLPIVPKLLMKIKNCCLPKTITLVYLLTAIASMTTGLLAANLLPIGIATAFQSASAPGSLLIGRTVFKETISLSGWLSVGLIVVGVVLLGF